MSDPILEQILDQIKGINNRLEAMEKDISTLKSDTAELKADMKQVKADVSEIKVVANHTDAVLVRDSIQLHKKVRAVEKVFNPGLIEKLQTEVAEEMERS